MGIPRGIYEREREREKERERERTIQANFIVHTLHNICSNRMGEAFHFFNRQQGLQQRTYSWSRWIGAGYFHQELTACLWANHFISLSIGLSPGKWRTRVGKITLSLSSYGEDCIELKSPKASGTWKRFNRHCSCGCDS